MALAREQARRRIEPDPARAGHIDFGPGVQIGEILLRAGRAVERLLVGLELDQVARHEARRQPEIAHDIDEKPAGIAARAGLVAKRLFRRLHARLHANEIFDVVLELPVQRPDEVDGRFRVNTQLRNIILEQRPRLGRLEIGRQLFL